MDDFYVTIPYGLVVLGGGVAGYVKRGSVASLAAAAGFGGAPLLAGALSIWAFTGGHSSSLFATVLHTGRTIKKEKSDDDDEDGGDVGDFASLIDFFAP
uniref:Transmembrane protein 14C n=1 Tax=Aegilops tauschii TaxID=37682 RepID=M8BXY6_AEGTA